MDNISTQLADLAVTRALVLQRVSNGLSKSVSQAYLSVIDDVTKQLKSGDDINIKNVNKIIKELQSRMEVNLDIESDLTKLGMSEAQWAQSSVNGAVGIDLMSKLPTEATIAKIVGESYIDGATINEWFNSVNDSMKNDLKKSVRVGMLEGETTIQIAKRVRDSLGVSLNHADSISRTAVATVSNNARMATYEANDDVMKGWEHISALDNRTSQVCATRDGATWSLDHKGLNDKGKKFPFQKPPLHFRCRSLLSPLLKSYEELGLMGIDIPEGTRSAMDGSVSSGTNFEKWFESKDSKFQEKYLGKQRYEMFKAGKITFNDLVGQNGMTLTIKELGLIDKGIMKVPTIDFGYDGKFNHYVADIRDEAKIVIDKLPKPNDLVSVGSKGLTSGKYKGKKFSGMYDDEANIIYSMDSQKTFIHEYGHFVDYNAKPKIIRAGGRITITQKLSEMASFKDAFDKDRLIGYGGGNNVDSIVKLIDDSGYDVKTKTAFGISDIFDAISGGKVNRQGYAGHGSIFAEGNNLHTETFANLFEIYSRQNEWDRAKQLFPNMTSEFENIMKDVTDGKFN